MSGNPDLVFAGVQAGGAGGTGLCFVGPKGTTAPTSAVSVLNVAFLDAGLVNTSGLVHKSSSSTKDINAYGLLQPVRTLNTGSTKTFDIGFLETNPVTLALYHGKALGSLIPDSTGMVSFTTGGATSQRFAAVFEIVDGANHIRIYAPDCEVTATGDFTAAASSEISYAITITPYPGSDGSSLHWWVVMADLAT